MKKFSVVISGFLLFLVLLGYLMTFRVDFDESALLVTFGKASREKVFNADGRGAGLHFKWPSPVQKVLCFERRTMVFSDQLEQQETLDKQVIILKTFLAWRIVSPLDFYRSFRSREYCERFLSERLRAARSEIGRFRFDDLVNSDPRKLRMAEAENVLLRRMRGDLAGQNTGIEIQEVGISRIVLPLQITRNVFARMSQTRQRLAQKAYSEGEAIAMGIRAKTDSDCRRILAYAEREAENIRAQGDAEAAEHYRIFAQDEKLAIFLRNLEALKKTLANNSTFLLDTKIAPFDLLQDLQKHETGNEK